MATSYTPGPWHRGAGNGEGSVFADEGRMRLEDGGTTLYPICRVITGWDHKEDECNAVLLAAAPEMYGALAKLVDSGGFSHLAVRACATLLARIQIELEEINRHG